MTLIKALFFLISSPFLIFSSHPLVTVFILSIYIDLLFGEPDELFHPVVLIGRLIKFLERRAPEKKKLYGLLMALFCMAISGACAFVIVQFSLKVPLIGILISAYLLKSTFSISALSDVSEEICKTLIAGDISAARKRLQALCSRDARTLSEGEISSAVIESVGENFVDGFFSPLFFFILFAPLGFGIPAAIVYKTINTLDSMVGYKDDAYLDLGYFSAKLDDLANYIPSRISILFLMLASLFFGNTRSALSTCRSDHARTESPNSGYPMSAMSGALMICLKKPSSYTLGRSFPEPVPEDISRAMNMVWMASLMLFTFVLMIQHLNRALF